MSGLRDRVIWRGGQFPPLGEQVRNAAGAGARAVKAAATGGGAAASDTTIAKRRETCQSCDNWIGGRCKLCGCFTSLKIRLATESCPIGKWGEERSTKEP